MPQSGKLGGTGPIPGAQNEQHKRKGNENKSFGKKTRRTIAAGQCAKLVTAYYTDVPEHTLRPQLYRGAPG
jgi:hypothetical protein